jgi:hypothetical protein
MIAWHMAGRRGKPELLQKIWGLAEEKLTALEIKKNKLLLATDDMGETVLHAATERYYRNYGSGLKRD